MSSMEDGDGKATARPFLVLDHIVRDYRPTANRRTGDWHKVDCRRNAAYGCGRLGDDIISGLSLFARLGDDGDPDGFPSLCLGATEDVFRRVGAEVPDDVAKSWGRHVRLASRVVSVSGDAMVCSVSFAAANNKPLASYYLVYLSAADGKSLSLLPHCETTACNWSVPLPVPHGDGGGDYTLALNLATTTADAVICLASLGGSCSSAPWGTTKESRVRGRAMADELNFRLEDVFLFKGKAVWSDLMKGILYCDSSDLLNQNAIVDFKLVLLPDECWHRL